jgi:hypothetical protein
MSLLHRLICCLLSLSLGLPATPAVYAAQGTLQPRSPAKGAQKQPAQTRAIAPDDRPAAQPAAKGAARAQATRPAQPAGALPKAIDLTYVQPDAFAVVVAHPRAFFEAPEMELFPREVVTAAVMKEAGVDPAKIDRVVISIANFNPPREPSVAGVAYFSEPLDPNLALGQIKARAKRISAAGKEYWVAAPPLSIAFYLPDDRTIVMAPEPVLKQMLAGRPAADNPLLRRLKATDFSANAVAVVSLDAVRDQVTGLMAQVPPLPPQFQQFTKIPELTSAVEVRAQIGGSPDLQWTFHARDAQSATQLERLINEAVAIGKELILAQMGQQFQGDDDPVQLAAAQYMRRFVNHIAALVKPVREGEKVTITVATQGGWATAGVLVALLLPAVQAAREAARRNASINNMRQIGLALLNYHDIYKSFPPRAVVDKQGKPLLSWRVKILPYVEENELYKQFRLDEPWDSEHNKELLSQMPAVYRNPNLPDDTKTNYLVPVGDDTIFSGDEGARLHDIRDGTSKTIMVLEVDADRAVPWTKPDDYEVDADEPLAGLGHIRAGGIFLAAFADCSVRPIVTDIGAEVVLRLLKKSDGQPVPIP